MTMTSPTIRQARASDAVEINRIRLSVRENVLSDPSWLTEDVTVDALTRRGRGWVVEDGGKIQGFSIALRDEPSIWAVFIRPEAEGRGFGKRLLNAAVEWLWSIGAREITLSTDPKTRAEQFYRRQGWREIGTNEKGEVCFVFDPSV